MLRLLPYPSKLKHFDAFLYSPAYFFLVGSLTLISNFFCAELFTYTCFILLGLYLCFFGRDLLPIMPLAICSYIAPSRDNNPGINEQSVFSAGSGIYLVILAAVLVVGLIWRLIRDPELGRMHFLRCKRFLLPGMLALGCAYLLSGIGSGQLSQVGTGNLLFAFIQAASIIILYYLLTAMVKWDQAPKGYLAWTGMCVGFVLVAELIFIYGNYYIIRQGEIDRYQIFTGWGNYNNIGALLAMMIPFPFFLTGKGKHTGIFYISGLLFLCAIVFTCSRNSIVCGAVIYVISYMLSLLRSRRARANMIIHICTVLAGIALFVLYFEDLVRLFHGLMEQQMAEGGRYESYIAGWKQFLDHPIFGGSFYPVDYDKLYSWSTSEAFVAFFPPRWHNTLIQISASCGIVGIAAYLYHRVQVGILLFRHPIQKKMFVLLSIAALLATSLLDCHFFNVGPTLFYSMALAFVEKRLS